MILGNNLGDYISNKERISVKAAKITHILLYILLGSVQEKKDRFVCNKLDKSRHLRHQWCTATWPLSLQALIANSQ